MKKKFVLLSILVLAAAVRLYHITGVSLWHDEAFSALLIRYPWKEMIYRIALDVHPPGYYIVLRLWSYLFGNSVLALRGMSVFFGVGTVGMAYLFSYKAFKSEKLALITALLMAISPFQTKFEFTLEARMYTFGTFATLSAAYFLVSLFERQPGAFSPTSNAEEKISSSVTAKDRLMFLGQYCGLVLSLVAMLYTHYYLYFSAAGLGVYACVYAVWKYRWHIKQYLPVFSAFFFSAVSLVPWIRTLLFQVKQVEGGYWIPAVGPWSISDTFWEMLLGFRFDDSRTVTRIALVCVTLFCLYFFYRFIRRTESLYKWLVCSAFAMPFVGSMAFYALSVYRGGHASVYLARYFLYSGLFFICALASWITSMSAKKIKNVALVSYCICNIVAFFLYWNEIDVASRPGMDAAAQFLHANVEPGQKIFVGISSEFFNYLYYTRSKYTVPVSPKLYQHGAATVSEVPHYAGSALLTDSDLVSDFDKATQAGDTVWLLWTNAFYSGKPNVPGNWVSVDEKLWPEVRPQLGTNIYVTEYKVNSRF